MNNTDATRLRTLADWFDMYDAKNGNIGMDEVQTSLRDIANRIESSHAHRSRLIESVKKWGGAWRKCRAELKEARKRVKELEELLASDSVYGLLRFAYKSPDSAGVYDVGDNKYYDLYVISKELRESKTK